MCPEVGKLPVALFIEPGDSPQILETILIKWVAFNIKKDIKG